MERIIQSSKDDIPENTNSKIKNILEKNGIKYSIDNCYNILDKIFSCQIDVGTSICRANGKGITREFTLASAFGELMERMQSKAHFAGLNFPKKHVQKYGFVFSPYEQQFQEKSCIPSLPEVFKKSFPFLDGMSLSDAWEIVRKNIINKDNIYRYASIPFLNIYTNEVSYLPYYFILFVYGSNGMSAGNSNNESITQGLSEILERYVKREIYFKKITPPDIPRNVIKKKYPNQYAIIKEIEKNSFCHIIIKDCALEKMLPVVCMIIIDKKKNMYSVKFAAELDIGIGIERCLTEYYQGIDFKDTLKMNNIDLSEIAEDEVLKNFTQACVVGNGLFPPSLLSGKFSYEYTFPAYPDHLDNKQKLKLLLKLIQGELGFHDIFIADNDILGFPAHQIIIPGMSELTLYNNLSEIEMRIMHNGYNIFIEFDKFGQKDLLKMIKDIERKQKYHVHRKPITLDEYFGLRRTNNHLMLFSCDFLLSLIYFKLGDYKLAHRYMKKYITFVREFHPKSDIKFYYFLKDFFALKARDCSHSEIRDTLAPIHDISYLDYVTDVMINQNKHFGFLYTLFPDRANVYNHADSELYLKLKKAHTKVPFFVDQYKKYFSELLQDERNR
ncbi:MAG: YcaO-like family protein [Candidatus Pacearchaeota archaeon]|nr:YcaO-like family protein [Candidatus Pacearchaeota archaeon]